MGRDFKDRVQGRVGWRTRRLALDRRLAVSPWLQNRQAEHESTDACRVGRLVEGGCGMYYPK